MTKKRARFEKFSSAVQEFGFQRRSFFICQEEKGGDLSSCGYVDDIVLTGDDVEAIKKKKSGRYIVVRPLRWEL